MEASIKKSVNKISMACGGVIALQGLNINFIISLAISLIVLFCVSALVKANIQSSLAKGELNKEELQKAILTSPYIWLGLLAFVILALYF
ncbi:hypothetical protein [Pseudoalteromonas luteoviolacea]|uniref:hypothetical protein n=1 Tax=Pseudoalteromonas luteoviolacea TaxID=43657 RepID=UPI0011546587|nr:hypothetical protein [Pseudoalteromonas luteoviolacea]TQF70138.1 hypothetical protein FLM44_03325 [Pseudoalteromonas luteoviolacea]